LITRGGVGIGEAAFVTIAPSLLADYYPPVQRPFALGVWNIGGPIGGALGFILGGQLSEKLNWRYAFLITGFPGLIMAVFIYFLNMPTRGAWEETKPVKESLLKFIKILWSSKLYMVTTLSMMLFTASLGAMSDWLQTYLARVVPGYSLSNASLAVGAITVVTGIGGALLGAWISDKVRDRSIQKPLLLTCLTAMFFTTLLSIPCLYTHEIYSTTFFLFLCELFLFTTSGPTNSLIANSVPASIRGRAFGFLSFIMHLGDAISPTLVGLISDNTGEFYNVTETTNGTDQYTMEYQGNITKGVSLVPVFFFLSFLSFLCGYLFVPEKEEFESDVTLKHEE